MLEIINNQRKINIQAEDFQAFAENTVNSVKEAKGKSATIAFVSDRKMRVLNKTFRGKGATTDVLSFPFEADEFEAGENILGDIIISVERAKKQAEENDLDFETEVKQLILHGVLHLCGYDHETDSGEMNRTELKLREKLKI
ncbi:MAG: rRNA maturation RNase YbeY [Acidobacteriota bacterium]|nr:rRNA maturation RNase YbeY [Acidobacteriota bacterium]